MVIKRDILSKLIKWRDSKNRKPLILQGARQVGKTWALKQFGKEKSPGDFSGAFL